MWPITLAIGKKTVEWELTLTGKGQVLAQKDDGAFRISILSADANRLTYKIDDDEQSCSFVIHKDTLFIDTSSDDAVISDITYVWEGGQSATAGGEIVSPIHGNLLDVFCEEGKYMREGQPLFVLEAMKQEHTICAPQAGTITSLLAKQGMQVEQNQLLATLTLEETDV